jgi:hypothetical protein
VGLILLIVLSEGRIADHTDKQYNEGEKQQSSGIHANILPEECLTISSCCESGNQKTSKAARNLAAFDSAQCPGGGETTCSD